MTTGRFGWGSNWFGALGIGKAPDTCPTEECAKAPALVAGIHARSIAAGGDVTCAILEDGRVACWGQADMGQMGTLTGLDACTVTRELCARRPHVVSGIDHVVQLAVGGWHVCALREDGTVWCWGANDFGQLGVRDAPEQRCQRDYACMPSPTPVPGLLASEIAAGPFHTCALTKDDGVACWGRDDQGELAGPPGPDRCKLSMGTIPCGRSPRRVASLSSVEHLWPGATCAAAHDGVVSCWASDVFRQLGASAPRDRCIHNGDPGGFEGPCSRTPVQVPATGSVRGLATNGSTSCAMRDDGSVVCWGANGAGQAGPRENPPTLCEFLPNQREPCVASPHTAFAMPPR